MFALEKLGTLASPTAVTVTSPISPSAEGVSFTQAPSLTAGFPGGSPHPTAVTFTFISVAQPSYAGPSLFLVDRTRMHATNGVQHSLTLPNIHSAQGVPVG